MFSTGTSKVKVLKIAVISDIHGNHYALDEVLNCARKGGVEKIFVLGDIVGYYYYPEKILEILSHWDFEIIKGNHEVILENLRYNKVNKRDLEKKYGKGHERALLSLDETKQNWLYSLPTQKSIIIDNVSFLLNHGSPTSINEYIYPDASINQLENCNSKLHDFVLIGHSHYPFSFRCKDSTLINCGSVGQSRQKGGIANWVIINTANKCFEIKSTPYDTKFLLEEISLLESENCYSYKILLR